MWVKIFSFSSLKYLLLVIVGLVSINQSIYACDGTVVTAISTTCSAGNVAVTFEMCDSPSNGGDLNAVYGIFIESTGANIVGTNTPSLTSVNSGVTISFTALTGNTAQYGNWGDQVAGTEFIGEGISECHTFTILFDELPSSVTISGSTSNSDQGSGLQLYQGEWACFQSVVPPSCGVLDVCYNGTELIVTGGNPGYTWSTCDSGNSGSCTSWTAVDNDAVYPTSSTTDMIMVEDANGGYTTIILNGVTDVEDCSTTCTPPTISITGSDISCNALNDGSADLTINSGTSTYSFLWSNSATSEDLTGLSPGTYDVTVTDDADASCSVTGSIEILEPPPVIADFTAPIVCEGITTSFTDASSTGVDTWNWDFDNDGTVDNTTQNPSHTFPSSGTFPVNLEVSIGGACSHDTTINVTVNQGSTADFTAPVVCLGLATDFTDISIGGVDTWDWDFDNDGTVDNTTQNPSYTFPSSGIFPVNLEVSVGGNCMHDTTINVIVNQSATANFTPETVCVGVPSNFSDISIGGVDTWNWDFDNDGTVDDTNQNPTYTFPSSGTFPVSLQVSVGGNCMHDTIINVTVTDNFTAEFTFSEVCLGASSVFTDGSSSGADTWNWDFDNDGTVDDTSQNPTYTFPSTGTYSVNLEVSVGGNCMHDTTISVDVNPTPIAAFTFSDECFGSATNFTDGSNGNGGVIDTWNWDFTDNGIVDNSNQNPSNGYASEGNFTAELLVVTTDGCKDSITVNIDVDAIPVANFGVSNECLGSATSFTDSTLVSNSNINQWSWDFGDASLVDNNQDPTHQYTTSGIFNVTLTVTSDSGCTNTVILSAVVSDNPIANFTTDTACSSLNSSFTDITTFTVGIETWEWDFDNNATVDDGNQNPTFIFAGAGTYPVNLNVIDSFGCTHDTTLNVLVSDNPTASFAFTSECFGTATTFTNQSVDNGGLTPIDTWSWDFDGDGVIDNSTSDPTFVFPLAGTYNTELFVTSALGCIDSITIPVDVNPIPVAHFGIESVCLNATTTFNDSSSVGSGTLASWDWDFGDASVTSISQSPLYTYTTSGIYNVTLIVESDSGCTHSTIIPVEVFPNPTANFDTTDVCLNVAAQFTDQSNGNGGTITDWAWDFENDGTMDDISQNPNYNYPSDGTYSVELVVSTSSGCKDTLLKSVTIYPMPIADFNFINSCYMDTVRFTDNSTITSGTIDQWSWNLGNGQSSIDQNPNEAYNSEGAFDVELIVTTNNSCSDTVVKSGVEVWPLPIVDFNAPDACINSATQFTDLSTVSNSNTVNNNIQWDWDFADGPGSTSSNQNPVYTYLAESVFMATLTVTTDNNCVDSITKPVTVHPQPVVDFVGNNLSGCTPVFATFTDLSTLTGGDISTSTWDWDFNGDGLIDANSQNPGYSFTNPSNSSVQDFDITLTVTTEFGCVGSKTRIDYVSSYPMPIASFSFWPNDEATIVENDIEFTDQSIIASTWDWNFGDGITSTEINPVHEYADTGYYWVSLNIENEYGCFDSTAKLVKIKPIYAIWIPNAFTPNGDFVNDFFYVDGYGIKELQVQIFDRWGVKMFGEEGLDQAWDGVYKGVLVPLDVYVYKIRVRDVFDVWHDYMGTVTVVK